MTPLTPDEEVAQRVAQVLEEREPWVAIILAEGHELSVSLRELTMLVNKGWVERCQCESECANYFAKEGITYSAVLTSLYRSLIQSNTK